MSLLRLVRNSGVLAKSLAPLVTDTCCAARSSFASRFVALPSLQNYSRTITFSALRYCEAHAEDGEEGGGGESKKKSVRYDKPNRDRSNVIPVETSVEYMKSSAYQTTYGKRFVWHGYRRVHKGGTPPKKTRESCIRFRVVTTSSPCPICRDEYLVLDHRNLDLLKQFISSDTGEVEPFSRTGLCQKQHQNLLSAMERAYDLGLLTYEVPFRKYEYSDYYKFGANPRNTTAN